MSMEYIRKTYGVPAKRGGRVLLGVVGISNRYGTIKSATHHVHVAPDDAPNKRLRLHPKDPHLVYLDA